MPENNVVGSSNLLLTDILNSNSQDYFFINKHLNPDDFEYKGIHIGVHCSKEKEMKYCGKDELNGSFDDVDNHAKTLFLNKTRELYPDCKVVLNFNPGFFATTCLIQDANDKFSSKRYMKYELFYSMSGLAVIPKVNNSR